MTTNNLPDLSGAIGLAEACKLLRGRGGRPPNVATVRRWANPNRGCWPQGEGKGSQILLQTVRYNGELVTLPEWVREFERRRIELGQRQPLAQPLARSTRKREAAHRRAVEALKKEGV